MCVPANSSNMQASVNDHDRDWMNDDMKKEIFVIMSEMMKEQMAQSMEEMTLKLKE